jgi:predicted AAA+ superfamily ATPase
VRPSCYYWRDKSDFEIDCLIEHKGNVTPVEIKVSRSADIQALDKLVSWNNLTTTKPAENILIYGGEEDWNMDKGYVIGWQSAGKLLL